MKQMLDLQLFFRWLKNNNIFVNYKSNITQQLVFNQETENYYNHFYYSSNIADQNDINSIINYLTTHNPSRIISSSFLWSATKEGQTFWSDIDEKFRKFYQSLE